ncbi:MAG: hypothetical protein OEU09_11315, partial [Rhodospirillales bacterium]|nr:hypothetical protein [Rhodospirillales bacterium]
RRRRRRLGELVTMTFLTDSDKHRIAEAIKDAESRTGGEIVTVIARSSDSYVYIPLVWASGLALVVPLPLLFSGLPLSYIEIYQIQLAVFIAFGLLFRWMPLKMRLIPKSIKRMRSARLAREQFLAQGLHRTEGRTGVLLFVSLAERYVEVLADSGINDKVEAGTWDGLVASFVAKVKTDQVAEGFLEAVATCGALLAEHFPKPPGNKDELPNHLVEL